MDVNFILLRKHYIYIPKSVALTANLDNFTYNWVVAIEHFASKNMKYYVKN